MSSTSSTSAPDNATSSSSSTSQSVAERKRRLEFAIQQVLTNNFDADSKVCLITIMKMMDNLLSKPDNLQVRSIRLMNKTFQTKVVQKQGHIILLAVGFVSSSSSEEAGGGGGEEEKLVLHPQNEDTQFLVESRRKIQSVLVHELHCKPDTLPVQPEPRKRVEVRTTVHPSGHTTTTTSTGFDVYQGHKFDGQSQAVGVNLGPPSGWKSKTEQELELLQNRQKVLEEEKQHGKNGGGPDRQWELLFPGQKSQQQQLTSQQGSIVSSVATSLLGSGGTKSTSTAGDSSLIAQHYKQQTAKRLEAENRGFTTKAMRDLEKMKKQKVYSHTVLAITFADGVVIKGAFKPREKIQAVIKELQDNVLTTTSNEDGGGGSIVDFELYQTPPRTLCKASDTLYDLGLVPAAKVHVSWKTKPSGSKSGSSSSVGSYLRRDFVERYQQQQSSVTMPKGTSVVDGSEGTTGKNNEDSKKKSSSASAAESGVTKKKKTKAEKERDMLARMMGK